MPNLIDRIKQLSCNLSWEEMSEEQRKNHLLAYLMFIVLVESEETGRIH